MKYAILIIAVLLAACTQKYAIVTVHEGGTLTVHGSVDPTFLREGTTETISPSFEVEANMNKGEVDCNGCHPAHAGELFGEWRKKLDPPVIPEPDKPADPPADPMPPVEPETPVIKTSTHFHHWNPKAVWNGVALVLCSDSPRYQKCFFNGEPMFLHGSQDKGRDVWAQYSRPGRGGVVVCDGVRFEVRGGTSMQWGDCRETMRYGE